MNSAFWDGFEKEAAVDRKGLKVIKGGKKDMPKSAPAMNPKVITDKQRVAQKAVAAKTVTAAPAYKPMSGGKKALLVGGGLAAYGGLMYAAHRADKRHAEQERARNAPNMGG